jgi:hypothetical protein
MADASVNQNLQAFEQTRSERERIPDELIAPPAGTDPGKAATFGLEVGARVADPSWRSKFAKLPLDVFDAKALDLLVPAARAVIYTRARLATSAARASDALVPAPLVEEATALKAFLLKLLDYHVGAIEADELAAIRVGTGFEDMALDFDRLSELTSMHQSVLARDPYYRSTLASEALQIADRIRKALGITASEKNRSPQEDAARAWTLFVQTYEEVAAAGRFLWRKSGGEEKFPSLFKVGRSNRTAQPKPAPAITANPD